MDYTVLIPLTVSLFCILVGTYIALGQVYFIRNSKRTKGTVIDIEKRSKYNESLYRPVVEFYVSGSKIIFKPTLNSGSAAYKVGDKVSVRYNIIDPKKARINSLFYMWGLAFLFLFSGVFTCLFCIGAW